MKLSHKKGKGLRVVNIDGNRRSTLNKTLTKISEKQRRKELVNDGKPASLPTTPTTKLTVKLNAAGNMRGLSAASRRTPEEMSRIRKMRKFYGKMMPVPQCNSCAYSANCPQMRAGYECAFLPFLNSHEIKDMDDLMSYMEELLGANMRRAHQTVIMETLAGGSPSIETSEQLALLFSQLKDLHNLKKSEMAEMTLETSDTSIIGQLFGDMNSLLKSTDEALKSPIDVPALIVRESDGGGGDTVNVDIDVKNEFAKMELANDEERRKGKGTSSKEIVVATLAKK